jgi:hypothetical protein
VSAHNGDRLLDDAERGQVDVGGQRAPLPSPPHLDGDPGARRRRAERAPHACQRLPADGLDGAQRVTRLGRLGGDDPAACPAWIAMTPMLCATMSCSSPVIRSRSAVTAAASAWVRSAAAWRRCWRIDWPISHAMTTAAGQESPVTRHPAS